MTQENNCIVFTTKEWIISALILMGSVIGTVWYSATSYANVRQDVEYIKSKQQDYKNLDDVVRDIQVVMARVVTNQDNIIKILDNQQKKISEIETRSK